MSDTLDQKKVVSKGYTLEVESWENDGDNYRTKSKSMTFDSIEEAEAVKHMCEELFSCSGDGDGGIGHLMDDEYENAKNSIVVYLVNNPTLLYINNVDNTPESFKVAVEEEFSEHLDKHDWKECLGEYLEGLDGDELNSWTGMVNHYNYELLGSSEYYYSRVYDRSTLYYSEQDVYCTVIAD
jgi:hypothetical protein